MDPDHRPGLKNPARTDLPDKRDIRLKKIIALEFRPSDPTHVMENAVFQLPLKFIDTIKVQLDGVPVAIRVTNDRNSRSDRGRDAQLFIQLTLQRRPQLFPRLDLTAGKFPLERHKLVF